METINDIVREMRENKGVPVPFAPMEAVWITDFHAYADRLEAAHKREVVVAKMETTTKESLGIGNTEKMREALERCVKMLDICLLYSHEGYPTQNDDIQRSIAKGEAALAKPPRNCDVGTAEEQDERFDTYCESHINCAHCPLKGTQCLLVWSQMPYEEGGAK